MTGCDSYVKDGWVLAMKIHYFRHDSNNRCIVMGKVLLHTCMYYTLGKAFPKDQCSTCSPLGCTGAQRHRSVCTLHMYGRVNYYIIQIEVQYMYGLGYHHTVWESPVLM